MKGPSKRSVGEYGIGKENLRGHLANSLMIVQGMLAELRDRDGEPFLLGAQDDLDGVRMRLKYALDILDSRP